MNFQNLQSVDPAQTYLDNALRQGREGMRAVKAPGRKPALIEIIREKELKRIQIIDRSLSRALLRILERFPTLDHLPPFYLALLKATLDYALVKKSLGALNWAVQKNRKFATEYNQKLKNAREVTLVQNLPKQYIGRIASVMKQIDQPLRFLEDVRKTMKRYPTIKTGMRTVAIYGFPNVGKTTLLSKLTGSTPEINDYAFTTKDINVGNMTFGAKKVQVVDTPGTLARDKLNAIEMQAELVLEHVADIVVYVYDLTESYPLTDQKKLLAKIKKAYPDKDIMVYLSKADLLSPEQLNSIKGISDVTVLLETLKRKLA